MGEFSPIHWLIVLAIIVLLFGGKKIPEVMKGLGEGIRSFKDGMSGNANSAQTVNPNPPAPPPVVVVPPATATPEEKK
jgi:sec-independent protein translocase protein TatA